MQYIAKWKPTGFVVLKHCKNAKPCQRRAIRLSVESAVIETKRLADVGKIHPSRAFPRLNVKDIPFMRFPLNGENAYAECPTCHQLLTGEAQLGKTGKYDLVCDGRCMAATGPSCECECQGFNHGGKWNA